MADPKLQNDLTNKNNPWIKTTLKAWQKVVKKYNLKGAENILRWCTYDTDFTARKPRTPRHLTKSSLAC